MANASGGVKLILVLNTLCLILCLNGVVSLMVSQEHSEIMKMKIFRPARVPGPVKNYTGIRVSESSTLNIVFNEQTIAIMEINQKNHIIGCELLEVKSNEDQQAALAILKSITPIQVYIPFQAMNKLMKYCQNLKHSKVSAYEYQNGPPYQGNLTDSRGILSIFKGVFPGTKWCGSGDIASSYYDIGQPPHLDKCCRTHDFCPIKIPGFKSMYGLKNLSPYTRSHCECDIMFYDCLKSGKNDLMDFIGILYFNLGRPFCITDVLESNMLTGREFIRFPKQYVV